uniref:Uncharacterized protein n=1 Tax=Trichuris muris TaxID=70415 RepID=A0A5S6QST3_TRIMR
MNNASILQHNDTEERQYVLLHSSTAKFRIRKPLVPEVPWDLKPWNVTHPAYSPILWNATCITIDCDPDISTGFKPKFNEQDGSINRRRARCRKKTHTYEVKDGLPLNPSGRTGLTGRGYLPRYGPNHLAILMFVWQEKGELSILSRSRNVSYQDAFIMSYVDDPKAQPFPLRFRRILKKSLMEKYKSSAKVDRIIRSERKKFVRILAGSIPSQLETDNAWVELDVSIVLCQHTKLLCKYGLSYVKKEYGLEWYYARGGPSSSILESFTETYDRNLENYSIAYENTEIGISRWTLAAGLYLLAQAGFSGILVALSVICGVAAAVLAGIIAPSILALSLVALGNIVGKIFESEQ